MMDDKISFLKNIYGKKNILIVSNMVANWGRTFSQGSMIILGIGLPYQGVSNFNTSHKNALHSEESCL